jgi:hypothetical protein
MFALLIIKNLQNKDTSLIRTLHYGPKGVCIMEVSLYI